ncbi:4-O-methyltransferase 1 [Psilocybe cubensis]|uniref:4-O-methyltransferase 1 n=2 Tax=Psilocybe cubensis TaxID=181762 RepID=A0ACB8GUB3_PSICU|nr:4-O-methyltransferase 1 [Psilocybe cubensis]KAH9478947.1 4-O-methyltransferase 1 [Psilocybe cubensis]
MSASQISQLASLISDSVATLERLTLESQTSIPDLNSFGFDPSSEAFRSAPGVAEAVKVAAAACMQLAAVLLPPTDSLYKLALGEHHSFAVRTCLEANVTEILREAGPEGLHVNEIAAKCGLDPSKLGRIMRYLVIHHIYREVKPYVFTNNRISGTLDTGKPSKEIFSDPESKYESTGFPALISHHLDLDHKCSAIAWDVLKDPVLGHSNEITDTIFSKGLNTDTTYWKFFQQPDNLFRHRRFGYAMKGMGAIQSPDLVFKAFDWNSLKPDSTVVDVGGGIGVTISPLAERYPDLNIVIQDLPIVVEEGKKFWSQKYPHALSSNRVKLQAQDFFDVQPVKNASVFFLKHILHNWPKPYMAKILRRLREAATPETTLIVIDNVLPYACRRSSDSETLSDNGGTYYKEAPEPLLPNYGAVSNSPYTLDLTMMFYFNAQEHTVLGLQSLLESTGWRLIKFHSVDPKNDFLQSVEAVPL